MVGGLIDEQMSINTLLIKHSEISVYYLKEIASLKSMRWKYSLEEQLKWMANNLEENDHHLLIYESKKLIAYANFVDITVIVDAKEVSFKGLGNVCTYESGNGYGDILMKNVNDNLLSNNWNGMLFCKENLIYYYKKYGWETLSEKIMISDNLKNINVMLLSYLDKINHTFYYNERNF